MKLFYVADFQNHCPYSYTDLAMKLGWRKEFTICPPPAPVLSCVWNEVLVWHTRVCSRQGCSSLLIPPQTETPSASLEAIPAPAAAPADTCPAINGLSCWMQLFHGKNLWFFSLMEPSQSCSFTLLLWRRKAEAQEGWRTFLSSISEAAAWHWAMVVTQTHIKLHFYKEVFELSLSYFLK